MSNVLFNVDVARNILTENVFHAGIYVYAILPQLLYLHVGMYVPDTTLPDTGFNWIVVYRIPDTE